MKIWERGLKITSELSLIKLFSESSATFNRTTLLTHYLFSSGFLITHQSPTTIQDCDIIIFRSSSKEKKYKFSNWQSMTKSCLFVKQNNILKILDFSNVLLLCNTPILNFPGNTSSVFYLYVLSSTSVVEALTVHHLQLFHLLHHQVALNQLYDFASREKMEKGVWNRQKMVAVVQKRNLCMWI